jgi:TolB-like protein
MRHIGFFLGVAFLAGLGAACMTTPVPAGPDDSLFLILVFPAPGSAGKPAVASLKGPVTLTIDLPTGEPYLAVARLMPGQYEVTITGLREDSRQTAVVEPGSLVLFPFFIGSDAAGASARPVTAAEQEEAARLLLDHIGIQNWFDRRYVGFGRARPKMYLSGQRYPVSIVTDPPGARVFIDNSDWGESPRSLELAAGKYAVEIEKAGYAPAKKYLTVNGPLEERFKLEKTAAASVVNPRQRFQIVVYPFVSIDDPKFNPYGTVFQGSIKAIFSANRRYQILEYTGKAETLSLAGFPDLDPAEKSGADLAIAGTYQEKNNEIFVHALLCDVKSRRVKFADVYTGSAGFDVFGSIDKISQDFAEAADKVLPEPGQPVVEEEADPQHTLVSYEKELFKEHVIENYAARRHLLGVALGLNGMNETLQEVTGAGGRGAPAFIINAINPWYELVISPNLSYYTSLTFALESTEFFDLGHATWDLFLNTGPKLSFRTEKTDISVSALFSAGFAPPYTVVKNSITYSLGPYVYVGGRMGIGYRYYLQNRLSERPAFIDFSLLLDVAEFRFNFAGYGPLYVPLHILLSVGGGLAL